MTNQYPQSIVCEIHPGRKAVTRREFHGSNKGEYWAKNVCKQCDDELLAWAGQASNFIDLTDPTKYIEG